jgi:hypothetical protein
VLRRIFVPKREEVICEQRKPHNEELNDLYLTKYYSGDQIEKNKTGGACSTHRRGRGAYRLLVGKSEGNWAFGRPRHRWKDNIEMDLQEEGLGGMGWIDLDQERDRWWALVKAGLNLRVS